MSFELKYDHLVFDILLCFHVFENLSFYVQSNHLSKILLILLISKQTSKDSGLFLLQHKLNRKVESIDVSDSLVI